MSRADNKKRLIRVFIASPRGLEEARRAFKETIDELNTGFGEGLGVEFEALGWEDTLSPTGLRVQSEINKDVEACDLFLLVLDKLWGRTNRDAVWHPVKCLPGIEKLRRSNTMEEFSLAMSRWEGKRKRPIVHVVLKELPPDAAVDPGVELKCVLRFRKILTKSERVLFKEWKNIKEFKSRVDAILRNHARPDDQASSATSEPAVAPVDFGPEFEERVSELEAQLKAAREESRIAEKQARDLRSKAKGRKPKKQKRKSSRAAKQAEDSAARAQHTRTEALALSLAESAARAALDGRIEEARQDFARALDGTTNLQVLYLGWEFFHRIGELDEGERLLRRWLAISGPEAQTAETAAAYGNLGVVFQTRGDLDKAEKMHRRSLAIHEKVGRLEGMADQYGNLGLIFKTHGDLYGAEKLLRKSLEIDEKLGRLEGIALTYGNLGLIFKARGNVDEAEKMHRTALEIEEKLGRLEGVATESGRLGVIFKRRGNLDEAERMHRKALEIDEKLGRLEGIAKQCGNLALIFKRRGDLDEAEKMLRKGLEINEKLGRLEGMARQYGNLGLIFKRRGDLDEARKLWIKARNLFTKIGMAHKVKKYQRWLDRLPDGDDDG